MTPEIKRLRAETDAAMPDAFSRYSALAAEREAREALLKDIIHAAGAVVQEAKHHELMPWFQRRIDELERVTTIGGSMTPARKSRRCGMCGEEEADE